MEEPDLPYDDGARTIFLYTGGTGGNPPEELLQLTRYMECSVSANAQTAGLVRLHEMVMKVIYDVILAYSHASGGEQGRQQMYFSPDRQKIRQRISAEGSSKRI